MSSKDRSSQKSVSRSHAAVHSLFSVTENSAIKRRLQFDRSQTGDHVVVIDYSKSKDSDRSVLGIHGLGAISAQLQLISDRNRKAVFLTVTPMRPSAVENCARKLLSILYGSGFNDVSYELKSRVEYEAEQRKLPKNSKAQQDKNLLDANNNASQNEWVDIQRKIDELAIALNRPSAEVVKALEAARLLTKPAKLKIPPLPTKSKIKRYDERHKDSKLANLNIVEFLEAVWGPWIKPKSAAEMLGLEEQDQLFTRAKLNLLDDSAYKALKNWINRTKSELPSSMFIPSLEAAHSAILKFDPAAATRSPRLARAAAHRMTKTRQHGKSHL